MDQRPPRPPDEREPSKVPGTPQGGPPGCGETAVDDDLLLRFRLGDRGAFDALVTRYHGALTRFFYRLCWDQDRAEDFVQDVYLKVLRGAASYEPRGRLSTFLFRIATNRWIDHYRSLRPRPNLYSLDRADVEDETPLCERLPAHLTDSGEAMDSDQEKLRLRKALDCLSLPHRLVVELAVYQQLPYHEIAQLLDIPEGTVKSRMHNAAKHLRQVMGLDAEGQSEGHDAALPDRAPQGGARRRHIA